MNKRSAVGEAFDSELAARLAVECKEAVDLAMRRDVGMKARFWWDDDRQGCAVVFWRPGTEVRAQGLIPLGTPARLVGDYVWDLWDPIASPQRADRSEA